MDPAMDVVNSTISFRVPQVVNGAKSRRAKNVVEKKKRKKNKSSTMSCFFNSCKYIPGGNNLLRFMSQL
jgi:hypothetical protein